MTAPTEFDGERATRRVPRSPSAARVAAVAVDHFAEHGYDGSSLATIAEGAGMRKASLYAHYAGKDDLFLAVLAEALEHETDFVRKTFAGDQGRPPGGRYTRALIDRYGASVHLRFLLRNAYAPPVAVRDQMTTAYRAHLHELEVAFAHAADQGPGCPPGVTAVTEAYLGIVDSLHVELVHGDALMVERRHRAMWDMFTRWATPDNDT
ncbi:TetR/AcrR family transcriptional regulator [Pseudokineococcus marinus]|uniref:TetR/AcrR family transcriptional regulator n=1 Tax=Pseudokineococcus marinus TaxID=351215 RepID=A0A849BJ20_9ACTN|nr:TetR/AcrR family transcriptional regulator [Pseudokineococcus marinus]NNH22611.1 TetR/AcrR family transcriptional regulator [Pseudokineococcus marinus]